MANLFLMGELECRGLEFLLSRRDLTLKFLSLPSDSKVALRTWYIAGNRITGDGLAPLCEVLRGDWKRVGLRQIV